MDQSLQQIHLVINQQQFRIIERALYCLLDKHNERYRDRMKFCDNNTDHPAFGAALAFLQFERDTLETLEILNQQNGLFHGEPTIFLNWLTQQQPKHSI